MIVSNKARLRPNELVEIDNEVFRVMDESELPASWVSRAVKNTKTLIALESLIQKDVLVVVCSRVRVLNALEAIVAIAG